MLELHRKRGEIVRIYDGNVPLFMLKVTSAPEGSSCRIAVTCNQSGSRLEYQMSPGQQQWISREHRAYFVVLQTGRGVRLGIEAPRSLRISRD